METATMSGASKEAEYLVKQAQEKAMAGDHTTAIHNLLKAIEKYPKYAEAWAMLGTCQGCLDNDDDALASYNKAIQLDPGHADAWFNKGMILKQKGRNTEATRCIEMSMDLYCGR
jgi:tetratricopeptide (TPR) repeat protein